MGWLVYADTGRKGSELRHIRFCDSLISIQILKYREKSFQQQLELLFQRDLYVLAINLAQKLGADVSQQNIIYRKYGDYLYQKQDYDTAMQQYLRAIDNTEPSQVIRKVMMWDQ